MVNDRFKLIHINDVRDNEIRVTINIPASDMTVKDAENVGLELFTYYNTMYPVVESTHPENKKEYEKYVYPMAFLNKVIIDDTDMSMQNFIMSTFMNKWAICTESIFFTKEGCPTSEYTAASMEINDNPKNRVFM